MNQKIENKYEVTKKISEKDKVKYYGEDFNFLLADLLFARGIKNKKDVDNFLNPSWDDNFDPFLFKDMDLAVDRILLALEKEQNILIFSDYDTDGIPGGALLYDFFTKISYESFKNFIPNRNKDGYGLTEKAVKKMVAGELFEGEWKPDLVITVDCGITDVSSAEILAEAGVDLIVTDHHLPKDVLPKAVAVLDHKRVDSTYPEDVICGCGVAFKLVQALIEKGREKEVSGFADIVEGWEKWLLDLVAISTVCDMVPLKGENRLFVTYGKKVLSKTRRPGLNRLIQKARIDKSKISEDDLGFGIGPRINAASRLEDPNMAFTALPLSGDDSLVEAADYLETLNNRRKYLVAKIMKEVWKKLRERPENEVVVIGSPDWPLGVLGLIAGKVADKFKKPAFVWTELDDGEGGVKIKGSCRSGGKYSVHSLMKICGDEFESFGGHAASGGFAMSFEKIHALESVLSESLKDADLMDVPKIIIDAEITLDDVSFENYNEIRKLKPYGMGNNKPHFLLRDVEIFKVREFGKEGGHLELSFRRGNGVLLKAIRFFYKDAFDKVFKDGDVVSLVATFEMNRYNGNEELRLKIEDVL